MSEIVLPRLGWTMDEGTFLGWLKRDGEVVKAGEPLFTIEGDKSAQEIESIDAGVLRISPTCPKIGATVAVGALLGHILSEGGTVTADRISASAVTAEPVAVVKEVRSFIAPVPEKHHRHAATPRARRVARERGIDLEQVVGTGRDGRIRERDLPASIPAPSGRHAIARNMLRSRELTAPVTLTTTADATNLVNLREQFKALAGGPDAIVPSFTDLFIKLSAMALKAHPRLNSIWKDGRVETLTDIHIGFAVDTEDALLVPVIRDVNALGVREISARSRQLVNRARSNSLPADAMRDGTFTVTNLGAYGIDAFTPIINWPECAILGIGAIRQVPAIVGGEIVVRSAAVLSLTFDHRIVDGAPAARFLQSICQSIEFVTANMIEN